MSKHKRIRVRQDALQEAHDLVSPLYAIVGLAEFAEGREAGAHINTFLEPLVKKLTALFLDGPLDPNGPMEFEYYGEDEDDEEDEPVKRSTNAELAATCRKLAEMFESGEIEEGGDA